jgi:DNA-directed RNA polymerase specialized sigma24 family protein
VNDIARLIGRSRTAVAGLLFRALKRLRKALNEQGEGDE